MIRDVAEDVVDRPGSPDGPCRRDGCGHDYCKGLRKVAATACYKCNEPIGYDRGFWYNGAKLCHEVCRG